MKRHLKLALLALTITGCLTSCLKDEETTVLYSSQQIPDINIFMPSTLVHLMGNTHLHFGDEPPRISGSFYADKLFIEDVAYADTTLLVHSVIAGNPVTNSYINLHDQHKGILKCDYTSPKDMGNFQILEFSRSDTTLAHIKESEVPLMESEFRPIYFDGSRLDYDDFNRAYIMGDGNSFTIYYYETVVIYAPPTSQFPINNFYPLVANIISGKVENRNVVQYDSLNMPTDTVTEQVIKDFVWGREVLGYFNDGPSLQQIINLGKQPKPGDAWYIKNSGHDVCQQPYEGDF